MMAIETPARIAVLGAGPIGLEAALYARYLGYDVDIYERGSVADNVRRWGHARMFSTFGQNRSPLGLAALKAQDASWNPPADDTLLTGRQFAQDYLLPLAQSDLLVDGLHEETEVIAIGRDGLLIGELDGDGNRDEVGFRLLLRSTRPLDHGRQRVALADVVIDTTGTYGHHNWLGHGGIPAVGELGAEDHLEYGLSDVLGADRDRYASRRTLLIGDGYTAASNLVGLAELAAQAPDTWITWITRAACDEQSPQPIRPIPDDALPERARLARCANHLAADDANHVTLFSGTTVDAITWHADLERFSVRLLGKHAGEYECDRVVANVGFRADDRLTSELQVAAPPESTGSNSPGTENLLTREPDFYILGAKSYNRDSRFLIADGLEQIRQLFAIIGDRAELNLYATMAGLV
jgi:hypothetical protein